MSTNVPYDQGIEDARDGRIDLYKAIATLRTRFNNTKDQKDYVMGVHHYERTRTSQKRPVKNGL